jgi:hypothetical protein
MRLPAGLAPHLAADVSQMLSLTITVVNDPVATG